jgi:hypothetical protein
VDCIKIMWLLSRSSMISVLQVKENKEMVEYP